MAFTPGLFGTHIGRRPRVMWTFSNILFAKRQSKVDQKRFAFIRQQDIDRLDIAMDQMNPEHHAIVTDQTAHKPVKGEWQRFAYQFPVEAGHHYTIKQNTIGQN